MRFEPPGGNQKLILKHLRLKSEWRANQRCNTISAAYLWQLKNHWRKKKEWQLVDIGFWWEGLIKMFYNWIWWKWKWKSLVLSDSLQPHGLYSPWNSPGQNTGVGSLSLLQGIFPTQELKQGLLNCKRILYQLSYQGMWWWLFKSVNVLKIIHSSCSGWIVWYMKYISRNLWYYFKRKKKERKKERNVTRKLKTQGPEACGRWWQWLWRAQFHPWLGKWYPHPDWRNQTQAKTTEYKDVNDARFCGHH